MLRNAMSVLDLYGFDRPELGVVEAAQLLGRHKSTVSRWLTAMERAGFLERDAVSSRYRVSMRLAALAEVARRGTSLQRLARPVLERLAQTTGETANLAVLVGTEAVNIDLAESPQPIMHVGWVGRRLPLHATASGKALLAWRSRDELLEVLPDPLVRHTQETITCPEALEAELAAIRARGYATAWSELSPDLASVAAPVWDHRGGVIAAIAVSAPVTRLERDQLVSLAKSVRDEAERLSMQMGHRRMVHA